MEKLRTEIVEIGKMMHEADLTAASWGNISARVPKTEMVLVTPSGFDKSELNPEDIIVINLEGEVLEGKYKPSIETPTHLEVHKNCSGANAIVHTHSPMATSMGIAGTGIPVITVELAAIVGGEVPLAKYACPGTKRLGEEVVKVLKNANAAIMENHGVIAVGLDLKTAFTRALMVEEAARLFIFSSLLGKARALAPKEVKEVKKVVDAWLKIREIKNIKRDWVERI